ncbi:hypothetical protein MKK69_16355 [Methylobacterium sp. J-026]|uniref:hypothetical protein n=1 Tax=Methylobacterium sp. J-026 TaxID=2836624 RepID=UPI001FBACABB|nr:hypothetical protein [Methylobacterium sp. J-026]MCJ2135604.1 hypothetical protein [Methylobacterium sp. J-026]
MGRHLNRRHPVSSELFTVLRVPRACATRAEHASIREIAKAFGVSHSCGHRWVFAAPQHAAATARNGGARVYPVGARRFFNRLWATGYPRKKRIAMAAAGAFDTVGDITMP